MSPFWEGFFSVFGGRIKRRKIDTKPMQWYHDGPWWEHPIYGDGFKDKKKDRD